MIGPTQKSGDNSANFQANRDIHYYQGASASDVRTIAELVFEKNFPVLLDAARAEAKENVKDFFDDLVSQAASKLSDQERARFGTADMQYALIKAAEQMARKKDRGKSETLSSLLINKAKENRAVADSVLTQAIEVAAKLNHSQIELASLHVLLRIVNIKGKPDEIRTFVKDLLKTFKAASTSNDDVGMLVCYGCASYQETLGCFEALLVEKYDSDIEIPKSITDKIQYREKFIQDVRRWFNFSEEESAYLDKINRGDATAIHITPVGRVIALSYMNGRGIVDDKWVRSIG